MNLLENIEYITTLPYFNYIILLAILLFILSIIVIIIISYLIIKLFRLSINDYNILFYQYSKQSQQILNKYGNYELTKIYVIKQPLSKVVSFIINMATLYNYDRVIKEYPNLFPYHIALIFEIKLQNNMKKLLLLEKTNSVNICENFPITDTQNIKTINVKKQKFTINSILNATQQRIGSKRFFNWNIYNNHCQSFTKELLITINKYNKFKQFIMPANEKFFNTIIPTEFTLHIYNSVVILINIIEKYLYNFNVYW